MLQIKTLSKGLDKSIFMDYNMSCIWPLAYLRVVPLSATALLWWRVKKVRFIPPKTQQ